MEDKLKISVFRHKTYKDVFLLRYWGICATTNAAYKTTTDVLLAIENANKGKFAGTGKFDEFFRENIVVKHTMEKEMELDGYSGVLTKEIELKLTDFEEVILTEN